MLRAEGTPQFFWEFCKAKLHAVMVASLERRGAWPPLHGELDWVETILRTEVRMNEVMKAVRFRHACKAFEAGKAIPAEVLDEILEAGGWRLPRWGCSPGIFWWWRRRS